MNGWIKFFADGKRTKGLDADVLAGTSSWSRSGFDGLVAVGLYHGERKALLELSEGREWHQFDRMIVPANIGTHSPLRSHRIAQAQITIEDIGKYVNIFPCDYWICRVAIGDKDSLSDKSLLIQEEMVGKWITMVMPLIISGGSGDKIPVPESYVMIGEKGEWRE